MPKLDPNSRLVKFLKDPWNQIAADAIPAATAAYFTYKKFTDFSAEHILDGWVTAKGTDYLIGTGLAVIIYATLVKIALVFVARFEVRLAGGVDYNSIKHLYKKNNLEIEQHLKDIKLPAFGKQNFLKFHAFNPNINLLIYSLDAHLRHAISPTEGKLRQRDLCISLYELVESKPELADRGSRFTLAAHYDPACFELKTVDIYVNAIDFQGFAGVRAIKNGNTVCVPNCSNGTYFKGSIKRRRHVKQYFGIPLEVGGQIVALLNIETHNKNCFASAKQMEDFFSEHLYPFKCLFEYQFLKRNFFAELAHHIAP